MVGGKGKVAWYDAYYCEKGCGFRAVDAEMEEHEKSCKGREESARATVASDTFRIDAVNKMGEEIIYDAHDSKQLPSDMDFDTKHVGDPEFSVALVPAALDRADIDQLHAVARLDTSPNINYDRDDNLDFVHDVWRMELSLSLHCPKLYNKVLALMYEADEALWFKMQKTEVPGSGCRYFCDGREIEPEIEYIVYDATQGGKPPGIQPHVDNNSVATLIVMLSEKDSFVGGKNFFEPDRMCSLGFGDAVVFRGEKVLHWITPVVSGKRTILQVIGLCSTAFPLKDLIERI